MEFAVLGSEEFVLGFRLAGIRRVYTVQQQELEKKLLETIADSSIGILAINSEDLTKISPNCQEEGVGKHIAGRSPGRWRRR